MSKAQEARVEIREIPALETRRLRGEILRPGQPEDELAYPGDAIEGAFHLAAYLRGEQVGIVSLAPESRPEGKARRAYRLRGMATVPEVRGQGVGARLLRAALVRAAEDGADQVWCNARLPAVGFYQRFGFVVAGGVFELPGIGPHQVMERAAGAE